MNTRGKETKKYHCFVQDKELNVDYLVSHQQCPLCRKPCNFEKRDLTDQTIFSAAIERVTGKKQKLPETKVTRLVVHIDGMPATNSSEKFNPFDGSVTCPLTRKQLSRFTIRMAGGKNVMFCNECHENCSMVTIRKMLDNVEKIKNQKRRGLNRRK